ncbi:unnamed protein product [Rhizoctonia solani]|uniref:Uncharacterized protein n=1 Tax=Rhizoctonia solani TaxID=456999 RepID=A0A8H3DU12_9AGAM|nr:unnamed protein product [Rhizoctonia solani]
MGNHSITSHANARAGWGRPLVHYYNRVYDTGPTFLEHRKNLGVKDAVELCTKARTGMQKICDLGERRGILPPGFPKFITLNMLGSISKLVLLPKALSDFTRPALVSGCIKLMATVQESGRISPFSYEYGYLCFRIMVISIGVRLLERSGRLSLVVANMISEPRVDPIIILSRHVEQAVQIQAGEFLGSVNDINWANPMDLLLGIAELPALLEILYTDRKAFSIALMHTNTLGLAGVMLLLGRCLANETLVTYSVVEMYCEVLWRYSNAAAWDKMATQILIDRYREKARSTWKPTFVDLEDCVTILRASEISLSPENYRIPGPFDISAIPVIMGFATPLVEPGSRAFLPLFMDTIVSCMWNAVVGGQQSLDRLVDAVKDIFCQLSKILSCVSQQFSYTDPIHKQIIEASFRNDLLELTVSVLVVIAPRSGNSCFYGDSQNLFSNFAKLIPRDELPDTFGKYFPEWFKFFTSVSALEISEDHGSFTEAFHCWNAIGMELGYDKLVRPWDAMEPETCSVFARPHGSRRKWKTVQKNAQLKIREVSRIYSEISAKFYHRALSIQVGLMVLPARPPSSLGQ